MASFDPAITSYYTTPWICSSYSKPGTDLIMYYKLTHPVVTMCYFAH